MPRSLLVLALLLASCGDRALLRDDSGRYRVVAELADAEALPAAVARAGDPTAVVVLGGSVPARANARLLLASADDAAPLPDGVDVLVVAETGAAIAVDCAVVASGGQRLPERLSVGARTLTAASAAAGGVRRPAPGDLAAAMLRRDHGELFAPGGSPGGRRRIAFVRAADGPWHERVANEVAAAAAALGGFEFDARIATGEAWPDLVATCAAAGAGAVLVSADDWSQLPAVMTRAQAHQAAVIAIDRTDSAVGATCVVGPDQVAIGMALGEALRETMPTGAAIVLLTGGRWPATAAVRRSGFARALGLRAP